jgi:outer membrane protein assembly factor BamB
MPFSSPASPRRVERNARLDPMGIYGTRSARRRQQLQRRRHIQNALLWLVGVFALGFGIWWLWQPHPTLLRASWTLQLPFRPATAPAASGEGALSEGAILLASQSGSLWRFKPQTPAQKPQRIFTTAFAPGAPLLVTRQSIFWPGGDGILWSLDQNGKKKWSRALSSALATQPALSRTPRGAVVVAGDDSGQIAAFDARSGTPKWKASLGGAPGEAITAWDGPLASFVVPVLAGAGSLGGLKCFDAQSGALRWRFPTDSRAPGAGVAAPAISQNRVFWCNDEGAIIALDARSGRKIWKSFATSLSRQNTGKPDQNFIVLRGAPVVAEAQNVVVVGGNDGVLRAFDLKTGASRWTKNLGGPIHFAAQSIVFEGQNALLTSGDTPEIFLLEAESGRTLRRWTTPFAANFGVVASGKQALALDAEGHLQSAWLR